MNSSKLPFTRAEFDERYKAFCVRIDEKAEPLKVPDYLLALEAKTVLNPTKLPAEKGEVVKLLRDANDFFASMSRAGEIGSADYNPYLKLFTDNAMHTELATSAKNYLTFHENLFRMYFWAAAQKTPSKSNFPSLEEHYSKGHAIQKKIIEQAFWVIRASQAMTQLSQQERLLYFLFRLQNILKEVSPYLSGSTDLIGKFLNGYGNTWTAYKDSFNKKTLDEKWPHSKDFLAAVQKAGLSYKGDMRILRDECTCSTCERKFAQWNVWDDPAQKHVHSPQLELVIRIHKEYQLSNLAVVQISNNFVSYFYPITQFDDEKNQAAFDKLFCFFFMYCNERQTSLEKQGIIYNTTTCAIMIPIAVFEKLEKELQQKAIVKLFHQSGKLVGIDNNAEVVGEQVHYSFDEKQADHFFALMRIFVAYTDSKGIDAKSVFSYERNSTKKMTATFSAIYSIAEAKTFNGPEYGPELDSEPKNPLERTIRSAPRFNLILDYRASKILLLLEKYFPNVIAPIILCSLNAHYASFPQYASLFAPPKSSDTAESPTDDLTIAVVPRKKS